MQSAGDIASINVFGPGVSVGFFWLLTLLITIPLGLALRGYFLFRARAKAAARQEEEPQPLAPGPALLQGVVETDDEGPAVHITINETGREWSNKGNYSHEWTEVGRRVNVQPFRLRLADETAILVRPDERIRLVDELATMHYEGNSRTRVAELSHGERAFVRGVLSISGGETSKLGAYRAGRTDTVLTGTRLEPLEASTGTLDARFSYWRRFQGFAALILGAVFLICHGVVLGQFEAEWLSGKVESAEFVRTRTYTTSGKYGPVTHYVVEASAPERYPGVLLSDEVSRRVYEDVKRESPRRIPFIVVPLAPWMHSIGTEPSQSILFGIFALIANAMALISYFIAARSAAPWYEQRKVIEKGTGRLSEKAYYLQVPGAVGLYVPAQSTDNPAPTQGARRTK